MIDLSAVTVEVVWVTALVAAVRARAPSIDGPWVLVLAGFAALLVSGLEHQTEWQAWLTHAGLAWVGAVGGVAFVHGVASKTGRGSPSTSVHFESGPDDQKPGEPLQ
jgi:uncharacterized membrane protein AbrB (regulator of aidB expression)